MKTILKQTRELIAKRRFADALERLSKVTPSRLEARDRGEYYVLRAKARLFQGSATCVEPDIARAIDVLRHSAETALFAEAKYLMGRWLSLHGRHVEAKEVLLEAYASFLRSEQYPQCAETLNRLSYVSLQLGHVGSARSDLEKCISLYSHVGDQRNCMAVTQNLLYVLFVAGELSQSIARYTESESSIVSLDNRSALMFYEMSAIPHALKGDIKTARKIVAKAKPFLDDYPREKAIYFENLGLINILDGKYAQAEKALNQGLELSLKIAPESALVSQIKRLYGDLYVATQQWDKAEQYTREGLKVAEKIGERIEIAACQRIFARIENHRGNTDKAREWFRKAIELFGVIGANYELAITRYLAGVSGLYQNGERQAFLWMAREYFAEEEVKPYLEKVDAALAGGRPSRPVSKDNAPTIIAESKAIRDLVLRADNIASADMTILLTGPTGTGKDLFARYIHAVSGRKGEFVPVNAAAIPNDLVEAELFGHTKGAFTGATECRTGLIEQADNGTLYLNEIADASPQLQAKLLEVIETKEVRALGGNGSRPVSVRIIAATNHDLQQRIADGHFRADLYHRLNEIPIHLPPLSERREDIPALVEYFLGCGGCSCRTNGNAESIERLGFLFSILDYPGNVRELKYRVEELAMRSGGDIGRMVDLLLGADYLSEREWLERVLERTGWNRSQAARCLGLAESTVRKRIRRYSLSTVNS